MQKNKLQMEMTEKTNCQINCLYLYIKAVKFCCDNSNKIYNIKVKK